MTAAVVLAVALLQVNQLTGRRPQRSLVISANEARGAEYAKQWLLDRGDQGAERFRFREVSGEVLGEPPIDIDGAAYSGKRAVLVERRDKMDMDQVLQLNFTANRLT